MKDLIKTISKGLLFIALLAVTLHANTGIANANLITNGSFTPVPSGIFQTLFAGSTAIPGWTVTTGSVDWIGYAWVPPVAGQGSIDLDGDSPGGISQTFPTQAGQSYQVIFDLSGNAGSGTGVKSLIVSAGNVSLPFSYNVTNTSNATISYVQESFTFKATTNSTTLTFTSTDALSSMGGPVIGNVRVTSAWQSTPGAIISAPTLAWNPVSNKMHMVVRGDGDTIWLATFNSDGSFNNDWTLIPGAIISAPALAWNPVSNKMHMVVRSGGDTIWACTFNSDGSFNSDWTHIPGTIISPPALVWNSSNNKMHMVVRGGGDTIWASTFNSDATFNSDWTQIPGAIISPPTLVWNSLSNEAQLVVQGSGNTVWTATFTSTGTFRNDWTLVPGAVMSSPALTWNPVINNIQLVVQGSGEAIWSSTFNSNGAFNGDWSQIPGAIIDQPAIAWNPVKGNLLIVVRGTNNSIWTMEY